ncbi:hypothetical protein VTJ49DRAFT_3182 [Mycothermus thermophilus]|uniref:Uncharacterized protein n=1 Tax=Humicola insolens TaxID=85995 RepID=A0ABR3VN28_HUMIN
MRADIFDCLPRPMALLLVSSILQLTSAHTAPRLPRKTPEPTVTIPHRLLNVESWPLRPTPPPGAHLFAFRRRQLEYNTVCGYIGGDAALPATCGAGSHCVVDTEHNVVGCCPDGIDSCTAGVFTGCVDANSGPQTEVNPYIYSCAGSDVCYMNVFEGGYSQFGCGTASDLAATVLNSASGATGTLIRPTQDAFIILDVDVDVYVNIGIIFINSRQPSGNHIRCRGRFLDRLVELSHRRHTFFFLRRRRANVRQGPGPGGIRKKVISPPKPGGGTGFAALSHEDSDAFETGPGDPAFYQDAPPQPPMAAVVPASGVVPQHPADRSMLPPLTTCPAPRMPFQNELSPVEPHDLDTPLAYSASVGGAAALSAATSAGGGGLVSAVSPSSYPPSSAGAVSGFSDSSALQHYPGVAASYAAAGGGLFTGLNPLVLNRGAERHLESDQIPLTSAPGGVVTREMDDFSQGFHAALGRIGEEDEEEEDDGNPGNARDQGFGGGGYRDHVATGTGSAAVGMALSSSQTGQYQQQYQQQEQQQLEEGVREGGPVEGRPLWQQNRRQSRNLMWM